MWNRRKILGGIAGGGVAAAMSDHPPPVAQKGTEYGNRIAINPTAINYRDELKWVQDKINNVNEIDRDFYRNHLSYEFNELDCLKSVSSAGKNYIRMEKMRMRYRKTVLEDLHDRLKSIQNILNNPMRGLFK